MTTKKVNQQRRAFLKASGIGAAGLLTGTVAQAENPKATNTYSDKDKQYSFYGEHQAGITTPQQSHVYFLVLDLHSNDKETIKETFQIWTQYAARLTKGEQVKPYSSNHLIPPADTGEADDLPAYGLTLTFGISPSFLEKLGLSNKAPSVFKELPLFPRDQLRQEWSGGDICIQACADNAQVAFHAIRQLVRVARSNVTMRWSQSGFITADSPKDTPRNLFGFKDGTANPNIF